MHVAIPCPKCKHYTSVKLDYWESIQEFSTSVDCDHCENIISIRIW